MITDVRMEVHTYYSSKYTQTQTNVHCNWEWNTLRVAFCNRSNTSVFLRNLIHMQTKGKPG